MLAIDPAAPGGADIALPRTRATRSSAASDSAPPQCNAVNSPRLCPTATDASMSNRSSTRRPASDVVTMAGCANSVATRSPESASRARS
jgi:hypothetical protein